MVKFLKICVCVCVMVKPLPNLNDAHITAIVTMSKPSLNLNHLHATNPHISTTIPLMFF